MDFQLFLFILRLIIVSAGIQHVPVTRIQDGALRLGSPFIQSEEIGRNIGYEYQYGVHDSINGYTNQVYVSNAAGVILNEPSYRSIPVSNFKTVLGNAVTKVDVPNLAVLKTVQSDAVTYAKNYEKSDLKPLSKITPSYKNVNPALRLPVQHIALVEDTSHISPTFSNAPDAIISTLLASGVSNIPPELFSQLSESLGSDLLRTAEMENESVTPAQLYTEALIDSPKGDDKIPVTDFFSVKYYKK